MTKDEKDFIIDLLITGDETNIDLAELTCIANNVNISDIICEYGYSMYRIRCLADFKELITHISFDNSWIGSHTQMPKLPYSVTYFGCFNNGVNTITKTLPNLPRFHEGVKSIVITNHKLNSSEISNLPDSIESLCISDCGITKIDRLPKNLRDLSLDRNLLRELPPLPKELYKINIECNPHISVLPTLPPALRELFFSHCTVKHLPELPPKLGRLVCRNNVLETITNIPNSIEAIFLQNNNIKELPSLIDCNRLMILQVNNNQLTEMPNLPYNFVEYMRFDNNNISNIDNLVSLLQRKVFYKRLSTKEANGKTINEIAGIFAYRDPKCTYENNPFVTDSLYNKQLELFEKLYAESNENPK